MTKASTSIKPGKLAMYYRLTKPGIIYGNCLTAIAGFFLASKNQLDIGLLVGMLVGLSLVVGSAGVLNNYFDSDIDARMERTKKRATASGQIGGLTVLAYSCLLLALGILCLGFFTNLKALLMALFGWLVYVGVYTPIKRRTVHATLVGSIAGAVPPVVGYVGVANKIDSPAWLLFLILVFWQMPHFYSIAIYRAKEYKAAGLPVLPLVKGVKAAKMQILIYLVGFLVTAGLLTVFGYTGYFYLAGVLLVASLWLRLYFKGYRSKDSNRWARQMFGFSLLSILVWSTLISLNHWLP
jgi:protoheme IX farnesyltransferase